MSLTVNALTYVNDTPRSPDSYRYHGPVHTLSNKDYMDLKRTAPKVTSSSLGKARSQTKLTRTVTDGTDPAGDSIMSFDSSYPIEAESSEIIAQMTAMATWLLTTEAQDLVINGAVNQA